MKRASLIRGVRRGAGGAALAVLSLVAVAAPYANFIQPRPTVLLLDAQERFMAEIAFEEALGYWPLMPLPERVAQATLAIEDQHFYEHYGVDLGAIARAALQNARSDRRISGASTIAMQVARMQRPGPRTYTRKLIEAMTAVLLTARYGRRAVLSQYLQIAPYGNRIRGIGYAARRYLNKPVEDLSWAEIAFLSAIPQSPARMNPYQYRGYRRAIARGRRILALLDERGVLDREEYTLARQQLETLPMPRRIVRPQAALHAIMRIQSKLKAQVASGKRVPLIVRSTIDLELQDALYWMTDKVLQRWAYQGVHNAAVIVTDKQARVRAYIGSAGYFDESKHGAINYANTPRPSGSTLKPFLFAVALDQGVITPSTIMDDLRRAKGTISNADRRFMGPLLLRVALGNSRNVPAANLLAQVGLHRSYDLFEQLGLHQRQVPAEHYGSGMIVGLLPVTLERLVSAYSALAVDGVVRPLNFGLADSTDSTQVGRRVFSEDSARQLSLFLSDPLARLPTFKRMGVSEYPFAVALKTGTSQGYRDAWTVAYTKEFIVGVWAGRADARPMERFGGSGAAHLAKGVIRRLHRADLDGSKDLSFPAPVGHLAVKICPLSGQVATAACERSFKEYFPNGEHPHERCEVHVPAFGRVLHKLAPRYAKWAKEARLALVPSGARTEQLEDRTILAPKILRPDHGAHVIRDPEVPEGMGTLGLHAAVPSKVDEIVWYVDGAPFERVGAPFVARWPLSPGAHVFEARVPFSKVRSKAVRVVVR